MVYLDTSALVPLYVREPRSEQIRRLLSASADVVAISLWTLVEAKSAFALKLRTRAISLNDALLAERDLAEEAETAYHLASIEDGDLVRAQSLVTFEGPSLRGADALHLAICARLGADLLTLDREMAAAAAHNEIRLVAL